MTTALPSARRSAFWRADRVADALRDEATAAPPRGPEVLGRIVTDTRSIEPGDLFVALRGERFDGHDFVGDAVAKGAAGVVVASGARGRGLGVPVFAVRDTLIALGALARYRRRAWAKPIVAVAGSNGKTSTKELVRGALGSVFEVDATEGNLNNRIGVPLTLLALRDDADVGVVELGTSMPGEIATLRALTEPEVAVVTSIGEEHLEWLRDLDGVLQEEAAVFDDVALAITPGAQPEVGAAARGRARRVVSAGLLAGDVVPARWEIDADGRGWFEVEDVVVRPALRGTHNLANAVLAYVVARECGVAPADAARGLAAARQPAMRAAWEELGDMTLVNDAYNASPASMRAALDMLERVDDGRPRVAVLGTMRELGDHSARLHDELADRVLQSPIELIGAVGEMAAAFTRAGADPTRVLVAPDPPALWPLLRGKLREGSVVLLKASRGVQLERLVPFLKEWTARTR